MDDTAATLLKHRDRVHEIAAVLVRHGLATWAARGSDLVGVGPVDRLVRRVVTPEELEATDGQRLRGP